MPIVDLLRRTKSLGLRKGAARASDHEQPNALDFGFNDTFIPDSDHENRRSQEVAVTPQAGYGHSCVGPIFEEVIVDRYLQYSSGYSPAATSMTPPHSASYLRDSEIGLAISSPWESSQSALSPGNIQNQVLDKSGSPGWPTFVQSASPDNFGGYPEKPRESRWRTVTGLLGKKPLAVSPFHQSAPKLNKDSSYQHTGHRQKISRLSTPPLSQEGACTYRCPPEWEYHFPQPPSMEIPPPNSRLDKPQRREHGPQRKQSWRRTLSRKKRKSVESRYNIRETSAWPLSPVKSQDLQNPLEDGMIQNDAPLSSTSGGSLLQVEIPTIQMERYSIMFSSLLQPIQPPSLLRRRQGPGAELKLENRRRVSPGAS